MGRDEAVEDAPVAFPQAVTAGVVDVCWRRIVWRDPRTEARRAGGGRLRAWRRASLLRVALRARAVEPPDMGVARRFIGICRGAELAGL